MCVCLSKRKTFVLMFCSMRDPIFGEGEEVFAWPGRRQGWTDTLQMTRKGSNHRLRPPGFPVFRALEEPRGAGDLLGYFVLSFAEVPEGWHWFHLGTSEKWTG